MLHAEQLWRFSDFNVNLKKHFPAGGQSCAGLDQEAKLSKAIRSFHSSSLFPGFNGNFRAPHDTTILLSKIVLLIFSCSSH